MCWSGTIDEWTLIKHAAALEGLCKYQTIDVVNEKKYKKMKNAGLESLKSSGMEQNIEPSKIDQIVQNINDNKRSLNGYPIKWYIEHTFKDYGLNSYCDKHLSEIYEALKMRNTVVHTGWSDIWRKDLIDHIKILRNAIYIVILSRLRYNGEFYLFGQDEKTNLSQHT